MKKLFFLVVLLASGAQAQQGFDSLMTRRVPTCLDISYNCTYLFQEYVTAEKEDSVRMLLEYWQGKCRMQEMIQRSRILYALRFHTYNDSLIDDNALYYMSQFRDLVKYIGSHSPT